MNHAALVHEVPPELVLGDRSVNVRSTGLKAMQERGRLQEGKIADITIFNPETVRDNSTYLEGTKPTTGIPYVLVHGEIVVKDEKVLKDVTPGQPIRFAPEDEPRLVPLDESEWQQTYEASPVGFHGLDEYDHVH